MLLKKNAFQTGRGKEKQQGGMKRGAGESLEGNLIAFHHGHDVGRADYGKNHYWLDRSSAGRGICLVGPAWPHLGF